MKRVKLKKYPETYKEAFDLYCTALKVLECNSSSVYYKNNRKRKLEDMFPSVVFFRNRYGIVFSDVLKVVYPNKSDFKKLFPTSISLIKLIGKYFDETEESFSKTNFDAWYGRDISKYIPKILDTSWRDLKIIIAENFPELRDRTLKNSRGYNIEKINL